MAILAQMNPVFQPAMRIITGMTNSNPCVVTTSFANQYLSGTIVRLNIPVGYGMQQANQMYAPITVITPTTFSISIDTTYFDTFIASPSGSYDEQFPTITPIGELSSQLTAATINVLNPNVPGGLPV